MWVNNLVFNHEFAENPFSKYFENLNIDNISNGCGDYIAFSNQHSIFLRTIHDADVTNVLRELNNSSSCDADGFQIRPTDFTGTRYRYDSCLLNPYF